MNEVLIESTERRPLSGAAALGPADVNDVVLVSVRLRRRPGSPPLPDLTAKTSSIIPITREAFAATYGASPSELDSVVDFVQSQGLKIVETDIARRTVGASGTVAQVQDAFGVQLNNYQTAEQTYRGYEGTAALPSAVAEFVEGIFGLDNRRTLQRIKLRKGEEPADSGAGRNTLLPTPPEVARLYKFPLTSAFGQTIGILEFDDGVKDKPGYVESDVQTYFNDVGVPMPNITNVYIDNAPHRTISDLETVADICTAGSVAVGAKLAVYFGPQTDCGFIHTVSAAVHDAVNNPSVLTISYGFPEIADPDQATLSTMSALFQEAAALGVTVFVATGDTGAEWGVGDGEAHVSYPATDPGVTAVGGTLISNVKTIGPGEYTFDENTWSGTGGGISDYFDMPDWQIDAGVPVSANGDGRVGRGVPDIAAHVGYYSFYLNGAWDNQCYGTSIGAPLYAAMVALINAQTHGNTGFLNGNVGLRKGLYQAPSDVFRDVADGVSNGSPGYTSGPGWDACTGFGSVNGGLLREALELTTPEGVAPGRWQVTAANKATDEFGGQYIAEIAGPLPDGSLWWVSEADGMSRILAGINTFFVEGSDGSHAEVVVGNALPVGRSYLTTTPDGSKEDNLSQLPPLAYAWLGVL